jgi:mRNA interferase MazF
MTSVRGDIYRLRARRDAQGHEQKGARYAVELQGPINLSTLIIAPTSTSAGPAIFRPEIEMDGTRTRVLVDQLGAVDRDLRLGDMAGRLDPEEMDDVDRAVRLVLGLL